MLLTSPNLAALAGICTDPQRKERLKSNHGKCWLLEGGGGENWWNKQPTVLGFFFQEICSSTQGGKGVS